MNQKDEGTWEDRGRDEGTNFILRIKEQETRLTLQEHDDDDDDDIFKGKGKSDPVTGPVWPRGWVQI